LAQQRQNQTLKFFRDGGLAVDLVTLVAMCSIGFEPEVMRRLIWQQSRGSPWSFSLPNDVTSRAFGTLQEALQAAPAAQAEHGTIRVGLTGLEVDLKAATAEPNDALFAMCPNVTIASERLRRLRHRCTREAQSNADPTWCAVAVWRGSWEQPDIHFAGAVMLGAALANVPNPELPSEADSGLSARDNDRAARKAKRDPSTDTALGSGLFAPTRDSRQPPTPSRRKPNAMFVHRDYRR
jgi:hypothetical protein